MNRCFGCQNKVPETDQHGRCANCAGNTIGELCSECGDEWATHIVNRKALCDACDP